jgi:endonuclease III
MASMSSNHARRVARILELLEATYGPRPWRRWGTGVSVLVETILSQHTSRQNSGASYRRLRRRFPRWEQVARAPEAQVEECIRVCGLSRLKAPRIQQILRRIKTNRGAIDLQFLADSPPQAALDYLLAFPGVGPKTARCVLLFAFGRPVFPVDTHIHRMARRIGLIPHDADADDAHGLLLPLVPRGKHYALHVLMIEHGRKICRAQRPQCHVCSLRRVCAFGRAERARAGQATMGAIVPRRAKDSG